MDKTQEALYNLVNCKRSCLSDRQQLKESLREHSPLNKLQQNLILYAYDEMVVERLCSTEDTTLNALQLINSLVQDYGVHGNYAFWSVESWCHILGFPDVASALYNVRPKLLTIDRGNELKIPPTQEYEIGAGIYRAGVDFPSGEISVEVIGETAGTIYYGVSINPSRISANNGFERKTYLRLEDGQYLKIQHFGCCPLMLKVRVIA